MCGKSNVECLKPGKVFVKKSAKTVSFFDFYVKIIWRRRMRITLVHLSTGSHSYTTLLSNQESRRGHGLPDEGLSFFATTSYCYCHGQQCIHLLTYAIPYYSTSKLGSKVILPSSMENSTTRYCSIFGVRLNTALMVSWGACRWKLRTVFGHWKIERQSLSTWKRLDDEPAAYMFWKWLSWWCTTDFV